VLIAVGVLLFLAISGLLARFLSTENVERDDLLAVLKAQAAGDPRGMLDRLSGCHVGTSCAATVQANAGRLRRPGAVKILTLKSSTSYSLTASSGKTRVAWTVIGRLPVVQCAQVRRTGDLLRGISVTLLSLSPPISNTGVC
jgi:hypothetical protein